MTGGGSVTLKFSSEAEDKEIVEKYQSGLYSYSALAEEYNLSKSTIINIVKRYPYNKNKAEDSELITTLKLQRLEAEKKAWEAFAEHRYVDFGVCASKWRDLNTIINDNTKNPFASVIHDSHARNRSRGLRYSSLEKLKQGKVLNELIIEILCKFMDGKDSWEHECHASGGGAEEDRIPAPYPTRQSAGCPPSTCGGDL
jgi:predicted DNA-binding protein YlxM (UPF0122 family)